MKGNKTVDAKEWQERYNRVVQCSYSWLSKATELLHAANMVLEKETEGPQQGFYVNTSIYMMLSAFALENVMKAIILTRDSSVDFKRLFKGHNLRNLAQEANISCTAREEDLLDRLSHFAIQAGRYPVPKKWEDYKRQLDGSTRQRGVWMSHDLNTIVDLIQKLQEGLRSLGIDYDLYDRTFRYTHDGQPVIVTRRITPHRFP